MEILNNIWNFLSTENEIFINLLFIPLTFVESFMMLNISISILRISYNRYKNLVFTIIFALACIIAYYFIPTPYYTIVDYIIMYILIKKIFNLNIIKSILAVIVSFSTSTLTGIVVLNTLTKIFNISSSQIMLIPFYRLLYLAIFYLLIFVIIQILNFKKLKFNILENFNKTNKKLIITNLCFALFTLCVQLVITFYYIDTYSLIFTILNFVSLFAYFLVSFTSLNRTMNLQIKTQQLENAENYNNSLQTLYDSVKGFKHDLTNIIHIIGGYVDTNDMEGLKIYYTDLKKDYVRVNNIEILNPNTINNPGIYSLIVAKQNKASELKVNMSLEVFFNFNNIKMPIYEFSRILGILLDNAIEAASECAEKHVSLMFRESRKNHTQIINIENTYNNKDVDTKTIFEKGFTGKDNHTGIGLWEVNQIISKNNNIVLHTSKNDKYFKQQLEIYY